MLCRCINTSVEISEGIKSQKVNTVYRKKGKNEWYLGIMAAKGICQVLMIYQSYSKCHCRKPVNH